MTLQRSLSAVFILVFAGLPTSGASASSQSDNWLDTTTTGAPAARTAHTATWTGTEMIVWGGMDNGFDYLDTGGRYNPITDSWTATAVPGLNPDDRMYHTQVWTGTRMLVYGGDTWSGLTNTGGSYDPAANSWSVPNTEASMGTGRYRHTAVWTGTKMVVWGGAISFAGPYWVGGAYDPAGDTWQEVQTASAPSPRRLHTAVWAAGQMIVWGGTDGAGSWFSNGAIYNPTSDSWTAISNAGAPAARERHTAVWTGSKMIIWGGLDAAGNPLSSGGVYDPIANSWVATSASSPPTARSKHTAVWSGTRMIAWGGVDSGGSLLNTGGSYDPASNSWSATPAANVPAVRDGHSAVYATSWMIVWGGTDPGGVYYNTGGRLGPSGPMIGLDKESLTYNGTVGGANPADQTMTVTNAGLQILNWSASTDKAWISVNPASGARSAGAFETVTVSIDTSGLPEAIHTGTITVADAGAGNSPRTVAVTLNLLGGSTSFIELPVGSIIFQGLAGGADPADQQFTVTSAGAAALNWTGAVDVAWLSMAPASGALAVGSSEAVTLSAAVSGLAEGVYSGTVTVADGNALNTPQTVAVTLYMSAPDPTVSGVAPGGILLPMDPTFTVTGTGFSIPGATVDSVYLIAPRTGETTDAASFTVDSATRITAAFELDGALPNGLWALGVRRSDGDTAMLAGAVHLRTFELDSFDPDTLIPEDGQDLEIVHSRLGWQESAAFSLIDPDGVLYPVTVSDQWGTRTSGTVSLSAAPTGSYDVAIALGTSVGRQDDLLLMAPFGIADRRDNPVFPSWAPLADGTASLLVAGTFRLSALPTFTLVHAETGKTIDEVPGSVSGDAETDALSPRFEWDPSDESVAGVYNLLVAHGAYSVTLENAFGISPVTISLIDPGHLPNHDWLWERGGDVIRLLGDGFQTGATVRLTWEGNPWAQAIFPPNPVAYETDVRSETELTFTKSEWIRPGFWTLEVILPSGLKAIRPYVMVGEPFKLEVEVNAAPIRSGWVATFAVWFTNLGDFPIPEMEVRYYLQNLTLEPDQPTKVGPIAPRSYSVLWVKVRGVRPGDAVAGSEEPGNPGVFYTVFEVEWGPSPQTLSAQFEQTATEYVNAIRDLVDALSESSSAQARGTAVPRGLPKDPVSAFCTFAGITMKYFEHLYGLIDYMACQEPSTWDVVKRIASMIQGVGMELLGLVSGPLEEIIGAFTKAEAINTIVQSTQSAMSRAIRGDTAGAIGHLGVALNSAIQVVLDIVKGENPVLNGVQACLGMFDKMEPWLQSAELLGSRIEHGCDYRPPSQMPPPDPEPDPEPDPGPDPGPGGGGLGWGSPAGPESHYPRRAGAGSITGSSVDPNDKLMVYYTHVVREGEPLIYMIRFENKPEAVFPALVVIVEDTLDSNLDPSTLEFGPTSHPGAIYSQSVDEQTGLVRWEFQGIDLPPNVDSPEGEGFVTFIVSPRAGLASGTVLRNSAKIWFDPLDNPDPIETNVVEAILDTEPPVVTEALILFQLSATTQLRVDAADSASEVSYVSVFGRGGPSQGYSHYAHVVLGSPTEVQVGSPEDPLQGEFFAIAVDSAGNESNPVYFTTAASGADGADGGDGGVGVSCQTSDDLPTTMLSLLALLTVAVAVRCMPIGRSSR